MTRQQILIVAVAICSAMVDVAYAQHSDKAGTAIMSALSEYDGAWNKKDVEAVSRMLASDYVYFSSTGGLTTRQATLDFLRSPEYKLTFVERSELRLISRLTNVAVISSRWKGRGSYGKEAINDDQRCGLVFVKQAKRWQLLSEHCTQIVSK